MSYMLAENKENISNEWEKYKGYTIRPVPSTCAYYKKILSQEGVKKSLIFGGTPEIRTLFQVLNKSVTLLDRSEIMIEALGLLTLAKKSLATGECFIQGDWLKPPSELEGSFDLIIGDDAINMVSWEEFKTLLLKASHLLKNDGLFVCHLLVKPEEKLINKTVDDVLEEYRKGSISTIYDLASRLNFIYFDHNSYAMGWQRTINKLGRAALERLKPHLDFIDIFGLCNSQFYCPPQQEFEKLVSQFFEIKEIFYPHEYDYCRFEPVYLLKKL